jgi:uncharacterized protein involved in cysteine biosynthesis
MKKLAIFSQTGLQREVTITLLVLALLTSLLYFSPILNHMNDDGICKWRPDQTSQ